jgi:hypothetical protein
MILYGRWLYSGLLAVQSDSSSGRQVSKLVQDCAAQQPSRQPSSYSPPWEPQISQNGTLSASAGSVYEHKHVSTYSLISFIRSVVRGFVLFCSYWTVSGFLSAVFIRFAVFFLPFHGKLACQLPALFNLNSWPHRWLSWKTRYSTWCTTSLKSVSCEWGRGGLPLPFMQRIYWPGKRGEPVCVEDFVVHIILWKRWFFKLSQRKV